MDLQRYYIFKFLIFSYLKYYLIFVFCNFFKKLYKNLRVFCKVDSKLKVNHKTNICFLDISFALFTQSSHYSRKCH